MNLGEIQEFGAELERINQILMAVADKTQTLEKKAPEIKDNSRLVMQTELAVMRLGWAIARISGDPNVDKLAYKLLNLVRIMRYVQITSAAINAFLLAPTGLGALYMGSMFATVGISVGGEMFMDSGGR